MCLVLILYTCFFENELASAQLILFAAGRVNQRDWCNAAQARGKHNRKQMQDFEDVNEGERARATVTRGQSCPGAFSPPRASEDKKLT